MPQFTYQKKIVCAVRTADCLPILLTNVDGDFVSAIHAGWRSWRQVLLKIH